MPSVTAAKWGCMARLVVGRVATVSRRASTAGKSDRHRKDNSRTSGTMEWTSWTTYVAKEANRRLCSLEGACEATTRTACSCDSAPKWIMSGRIGAARVTTAAMGPGAMVTTHTLLRVMDGSRYRQGSKSVCSWVSFSAWSSTMYSVSGLRDQRRCTTCTRSGSRSQRTGGDTALRSVALRAITWMGVSATLSPSSISASSSGFGAAGRIECCSHSLTSWATIPSNSWRVDNVVCPSTKVNGRPRVESKSTTIRVLPLPAAP
mmetsp:Transcript_17863/g.57186  ORF Transcript_17863/g.57186 Transcript_17863/m.57186 type:complete len:262 (-) Transcript_17863:97-882(-)